MEGGGWEGGAGRKENGSRRRERKGGGVQIVEMEPGVSSKEQVVVNEM